MMKIPELNEGERYAGIVIDSATGQPTHHLILLPGETKSIAWPDALTWAEQAGGALPTRQEQALLYANLKQAFEPTTWYWTSEQCAGGASSAWTQYFDDGGQYIRDKGNKGRVRAVRRFMID